MTIKFKTAFAAAAVFAGMASAAVADTASAGVNGFSPNPLIVFSNGSDYTKLKTIGMTNVGFNFKYDVGASGRVKSWKVWPSISNGYGMAISLGDLEGYAYSKSYPVGQRPKIVDKNVAVSLPSTLFADRAVSMCNLLASDLRSQGKSDQQIFSKNREVTFSAGAKWEADVSGIGSNDPIVEASAAYTIKVRCAKWQGSQIPQAGNNSVANPLHVLKATMNLQELALANGTCAVKLTTAISTNTAGATIKYRYVHSSGKKSKVFTTKTAANKIAVVTHTWNVTNGPGKERGMMRLEGVNNNFKSNLRKYRMDCKKAPGGFKPNPTKPKISIPLGGGGQLSN